MHTVHQDGMAIQLASDKLGKIEKLFSLSRVVSKTWWNPIFDFRLRKTFLLYPMFSLILMWEERKLIELAVATNFYRRLEMVWTQRSKYK